MSNSVEVASTGQVLVQEVAEHVIEITAPAAPATVEIYTAGPAVIDGPAAPTELAALSDVNTNAKINGSVLYYDSADDVWKGDDVNTLITITDGGSF